MKEILSLLSFPSTENLIVGSISNCNKRCDICTNLMVFDTTFQCTATGKYCCKLLYVGSSITFKERFCIHKSDINTGKKRCGAAKHFLECYTSESKIDNLKIQLIESVNVPDILLERKLW